MVSALRGASVMGNPYPFSVVFIIYCFRIFHINDGKWHLNTLRPRQNGRHLPDDIFKCISLNENVFD